MGTDAWSPEGFEAFRERYPATPAFELPAMEPTRSYIDLWHELAADPVAGLRARLPGRTTVVLIRGYLGNYMRGNLVAACRALRAAGVEAWIADNRAGGTVADNAGRIARELQRRLAAAPAPRRLIFAGHSKGGLEALWLLAEHPELAAQTEAVLLSQTPRGASRVLESLLLGEHGESLTPRRRWAERTQRLGLSLLGARAGGLELTRARLAGLLERLDGAPRPFRLLQTASWSTRPTTWLDSFHQRLGEIHPGWAHDGQFYLQELIWPGLAHLLLPQLDHAQPVMDGYGFDSARYWLTALAYILTPR